MAQYVYEFLWRGRPNGEAAYHVILAEQVEHFDKMTHIESGVLTPDQAEQLGFPLSAIIADINAQALKARDAALSERNELETALAEKEQTVNRIAAERDQAIAEKEAVLAMVAAAETVAA